MQNNRAFTLVELIVVITILAILGTIAFISLQGYSSESRDSKRISDLGQIRTGLSIEQAREGRVPMPDKAINVGSGTTIYTYQGYAGTGILNEIRVSEAKDPLDNNYYTYTINGSKTKFQLLSMLENGETAYSNNLITKTYADYEDRYVYTTGDPVGTLLEGTTKIPVQESTSLVDNKIDLSTDTQEYIPVFSRENNSTTSSGSELVTQIVESTDNSGSSEGGSIGPDTTSPTGGSFTINGGATETSSTNVTLNITCPSDESEPVEVAYGNTTNPKNWTTCANSLSHTLTSGDGNKTVYVRFRDNAGNLTSDYSKLIELLPISGHQLYTTPGSYTWIAPTGITSVSVVCVGGGGGGYDAATLGSINHGAGGGGGLGYKNNITVTPGNGYTVVVGAGGTQINRVGQDGGSSYFINSTLVVGSGGGGGNTSTAGQGGNYIGDGGGYGGNGYFATNSSSWHGGGGAGGYSGNGGDGGIGSSLPTDGQGGAGGGGNHYQGGGVGLYGIGVSGLAGDTSTYVGKGGSGGDDGSNNSGGGSYGAGGAGNSGYGGDGACRIIWPGDTRQFPSTNVGL